MGRRNLPGEEALMRETNPCNVVWEGCRQPPGLADSDCKHECYACGHYVCDHCSALMQYRGYGRRRICFDCVIEHSDSRGRAEEKIERYLKAKEEGRTPEIWNIRWT